MNIARPSLDPARSSAVLMACPGWAATPLVSAEIGGKRLLIKDETARMGLGAFKAAGGIYAVARLIEAGMGSPLPAEPFRDSSVREAAGGLTFICASAGNHGMAVAEGARLLGAKAQVVLSDTVPESFAERLRTREAEVIRAGATYEDSIEAAIQMAADTGAIHLADGSWPGYTEPPRLVMEGYTVIAEEMREQLTERDEWPDHVYLQAGVGGLAGAMAEMMRRNWPVQPKITVVEPEAAPCLKASMEAGEMVTVEGPVSEMGRLDCKTPSMLAFDILRETADDFVTVSEEQAADAVSAARAAGFGTTPSGAAGLAAALSNDDARPLVILSEGTGDDD
ncbi:MAG: pyridoxal-phosphate dependent enzyme [Paracoccaceae bacterium]